MEVKNDFHVLCDVNVVDSSFFMHADRDVKRDNLFQHEIRFGYYVTAISEKDLSYLLDYIVKKELGITNDTFKYF